MMDRYRVAKLVSQAGTLETRKRLQKVVFLLKARGCKFDAQFTLHHYGPYSHDLAEVIDDMVRSELLIEESDSNVMGGRSYSYRLSDDATAQLENLERREDKPDEVRQFETFQSIATKLLGQQVASLEFAATIAYFKQQGLDWRDARSAASDFKNVPVEGAQMRSAENLAREVLEHTV